jgi:hypothetical protein
MLYFPYLSRSGAGWIAAALLFGFPAIDLAQAQNEPPRALARPGVPQTARIVMRDTVTEQELKQQKTTAGGMDAQMADKTKPLAEVRPSIKSTLLENSIIISDGAMFTLVPVGSVLNLPPSLRNRVIQKPEGSFTLWPSFLKRNASWLSAREVPLKMAKGDTKAGEPILREVARESRLVVAVYKGGPISILEPVPEPKERAKESTASTSTSSQKPR